MISYHWLRYINSLCWFFNQFPFINSKDVRGCKRQFLYQSRPLHCALTPSQVRGVTMPKQQAQAKFLCISIHYWHWILKFYPKHAKMPFASLIKPPAQRTTRARPRGTYTTMLNSFAFAHVLIPQNTSLPNLHLNFSSFQLSETSINQVHLLII